jgi:hypothetical protein
MIESRVIDIGNPNLKCTCVKSGKMSQKVARNMDTLGIS